MKIRTNPDHSLTVIAQALGVHRHTVRKLLATGALKGLTLADVVRYAESRQAQ